MIPAGTPAGSTSETLNDIPAGSRCTVTETVDGHNSAVSVTVTGGGTVTVPAGGAEQTGITDEYTLNSGSLTVTKTIAGGAAGDQGPVTIEVECDGTLLTPPFMIGPGATGTSSKTYSGIPADSVCAATETVDGHTTTTAVEVTGDNGTPMTIPPGGTANAAITDTYEDVSGQLVVNKTITGDGAGQQGSITITVSCPGVDPGLTPDFTIAAGATSTSKVYSGLPPGVACTVSETESGAVSGVVTVTTTVVQPPEISASGSVEATVTDDYSAVLGSLTVTKTIAGPAAGQQGQVTIGVVCPGVPLAQTPPFVVPAAATGSRSLTYEDIPVGTRCLIFEILDGRTSTVAVSVTARLQTATIAAAGTTATVIDIYTLRPGAILVGKILAGPFAGQQGPITIHVSCSGVAPEPDPRFHHPGRDGGGPSAALLQQHPGRIGVHHYRDLGWGDQRCHYHRHRGQQPICDRRGGAYCARALR